MEKSILDEIEHANSSFLAGRQVALPADGKPFVVVCCIDPRLTGFIELALGLPRNRAVTIRVAGNRVSAQNPDVIRSLAAAVYLKGAAQVIVVGHTDCAMADFQATNVVEAFRSAGIPRTAFGDADLRTWFGAIGNVHGNVAESVEFIRKCGILAAGIEVYGCVIDTATGKLERVASSESEVVPPPRAADARPLDPAPPPPPPVPASVPAQRPVVIEDVRRPAGPSLKPPDSLLEAARMFAGVIQRARSNPRFQQDVLELKVVLHRERNPLRVLSAIEGLASRHSVDYPELPVLAGYLRSVLSDRTSAKGDPTEVIRRVLS